jgi:fructose-1,6-bisphosphatase/inositol monophosphatase family enzyme
MSLDLERIRRLLLQLGDEVRDRLVTARSNIGASDFSTISRESVADTIYEIDRVSEVAIEAWFAERWPADIPAEVVMEGIDPERPLIVPRGASLVDTAVKCILDPIDGTRGIMYDKRPAWFLAGVAPQRGAKTRLQDIQVAAMVELPTTKQWRADRCSAIRGQGVRAESVNLFTREVTPLQLHPSRAGNMLHGYGYIARFFPAGKALLAEIEQTLWERLYRYESQKEIVIFEDQYISTGGQFYELLTGHDRMIADLRPLVFRKLGLDLALCCHPYDIAAMLILREAGVILESPDGTPLDGPFDTTSPISWVAYANVELANTIRPVLKTVLKEFLDVG